jgi:hypothetical protein
MPSSRRTLAILLCAVISVPLGLAWTRLPATTAHTQSLRPGKQPRVLPWLSASEGRASVAIDTNRDGRSDVEELYENGVLVRRETDRDFDDQIDLVQDFDPTTRQIVRSVTDVNSDGVADLLVLFENGRPVFSKWMAAVAQVVFRESVTARSFAQTSNGPLPLFDPFSNDLAYKPVRVDTASDEPFALPAPLGLPVTLADTIVLAKLAPAFSPDWRVPTLAPRGASDLRGPPSLVSSFS